MDRDAAPAADAPPPSDAPPAADAPPTADTSGTSTAALSPVADVHDTPTTADSQVAIGAGLPLLPLVNANDAAQQVPITGEAFASITDAPPPVDGDLPDGALPLLPAPDQHHPQVAIGAGLSVLPLINAINVAQQVAVGVPTPDRFGHQAHPVAPLFGEGSLNRPNSKGKVPERLERRYMSRDDSVNNKNQALKALYCDLLAMKVDYQAAMMSEKKKEAQHTRKNYQNVFRKAEGLRRDISSNGAAPVPQPKGVTKDLS